MKNQNDIIVAVIAFVVLLIAGLVSFFTARQPVIPPAPEQVDTKMPALPANDVVVADSLPGGQAGGTSPGAAGLSGSPAAGSPVNIAGAAGAGGPGGPGGPSGPGGPRKGGGGGASTVAGR